MATLTSDQKRRFREEEEEDSADSSDSKEEPPLISNEPSDTENSSSKYNDIISKSVLIQSGSPVVYQLKPKKEKIGTLRRMTLGEKDLNKTNRTILLVGETGTGKSTLINALVNYTMGVEWEDNVWFQIVEEEKDEKEEKRSQLESQTSDVIVYEIFGFEDKTLPYSLTIIDTPGYGDTRGIELDVIISHRLLDLFRSEDGVHEINAVGLVLKATENRLSDRVRYIFDSVMSLFGKNMENNIVALITHSDGLTFEKALKALEEANIKCAKDKDNEPVYFLFNNHQNKQKTKRNTAALKSAWSLTTDGMSQFIDFLKKTAPQKMITTVEVLNSRIRLTACIQNLKERVEFIEVKQKEIQQTEEALKKYEQEMKNNEKFTVEVDEVYKDKQLIDGGMWGLVFYEGAVCCTVCEENCHYPGCTMAWYPKHCEVMKDGHCTVCTRKCPVSAHVKEKWIYVNKTRKVQKTFEELKEKYEKNKTESESSLSLLEILQKETEELQKDKDQLLEESFQYVVRLEQIALNADSLSTLVHLDFLIEKMKEKGDTEKVQKLEEMKRRVDKDKGARAALSYGFSKLTAAGKAVKELMKKNNTSLKYNDIISESALIQSGSPAVYQLKPKKEKIGTLTRMTLGEKDLNKTNRTILLVGETGTGKSTLINALVNYTMGVEWEDNVWFQIVEEEKRSQSESQTSDVIIYEIFGFEDKTLPYSLTIIDTPGYGDTRGTKQDVIVSQKLFDLFCSEDGVHEINAVGLVLKATENRLSDRLRYIFDSVLSLFGKDMEKNIVALLTHSDGRSPENALKTLEDANIKFAKDEKNQPVHFLFDNCQYEDRTEDTEYFKHADTISTEGLRQLTGFLEKTKHQNLKTTVDKIDITVPSQQQRSIKNTETETVPYKATRCTSCLKNCHYPCGSREPSECLKMEEGHCTSCKCPESDHVTEKKIYKE
ncbi:uncharacterized protein LOC127370934 [Dicentrarchus labrax]|uniref:uncharacterized protein LOC127370934 n=1 Tax=Dicentrarchus labrax TaxID=13489 RepID=UPI0021F6396C|nr:uncharacterized protein LOC127370934 [Dicentrarchus labrax]